MFYPFFIQLVFNSLGREITTNFPILFACISYVVAGVRNFLVSDYQVLP